MSESSIIVQSYQGDELKRRLLVCLEKEMAELMQLVEHFNNADQSNQENYLKLCHSVVASTDRVLLGGAWDDSLFLRNSVKPIRDLRERAQEIIEQLQGSGTQVAYELPQLAQDEQKLFVSIFQAEGHNLKKWELQLRSINSHLMGRPVYQNEEDIQRVIRARLTQASEAYIVVAVKDSLIQSDAHLPVRRDRNGAILITLKPNAVNSNNILEFVHMNKRYHFFQDKLLEQNLSN